MVTTPADVTSRIIRFPVSATKTLPDPSTATPDGPEKRELLPVPSAKPAYPLKPATVVTTPAGVTLRIVSVEVSAT